MGSVHGGRVRHMKRVEWDWINMNKRKNELSTLGKVNTGACNHSKSGQGANRAGCALSRGVNKPERKSIQLTSLRGVKERSRSASFTWRLVKRRHICPVSGWVKLCKHIIQYIIQEENSGPHMVRMTSLADLRGFAVRVCVCSVKTLAEAILATPD